MGMGTGGMDMGGPGGNPSIRKVEIPGPDEYEPPEAFRQQVRRYYEELVK